MMESRGAMLMATKEQMQEKMQEGAQEKKLESAGWQPVQAGPDPGEWFHIEMESKSQNEAFARVVVAVFMSRLNPTMEEVEDVKTAVSEAVTNAVIHGYGDKAGVIMIDANIQDRELTVRVTDRGKGIRNVKEAMEPMFTTDTTGERSGMGISFMEAFMDELQVQSALGEGTVVTMRKQIGR